jgi:transcription-repair coupling factor (superfamily II helicase)
LGLFIIDEEQRFGVLQKEKLKTLRASIDILSLSATPIPRTLSIALAKIRPISTLRTPPAGRIGIKTFVLPYSLKIVKEAIGQELRRSGQVYFLHNRIETMHSRMDELRKMFPTRKISFIHGRMDEREIVKTMIAFRSGKLDVLVATTIIENGLDLSNVNTLVVADSLRLGLGQAHQLRGRVGRGVAQAYAYFLYSPRNLTDIAFERLRALQQSEDLGSGFDIAMKDLELRGAGNILGKQQSGAVNAVGLNLYMQMLADAVEKLRGADSR